MKKLLTTLISLWAFSFLFSQSQKLDGLQAEVNIYTDEYGISHIYADNEADLFFAQGYNAARDRLFQFEVWRRQATGTVAEILGPRELKRDIGTRLFMFRGDMDQEMNYYHDRGKLIIESFVKGVNAYIEETEGNPDLLPLEFSLLGIKPQKWTPAVVISRHQGLLGNIGQEWANGLMLRLASEEKVREINWFHPKDPLLNMDESISLEMLSENILELYDAYRRPVIFQPEDLIAEVRNEEDAFRYIAEIQEKERKALLQEELESIGSNNWVVDGSRTQSGYPIMANDPHRTLAAPSLRYMSHLVAPGWNVIGGGEPEIPGISIGHNEYGAWGLTVYRTDGEDMYVYDINPKNKNQYWHKGQWLDMHIIEDEIKVKGQKPEKVEYRYTVHGPVPFVDEKRNKAYAIRCAWLEVGGSPYLASLRMDQAKNWEEFREACNYSHIPGENMIWADREGNIGWQAVGIAPIRRNFSGMVPVPGDGRFEWDGYLPIKAKAHIYNPENGYIITANEDVTPKDYEYWDAVGYSWGDTYRGDRLAELIDRGRKHSMTDMADYQTDYLSIPARMLVPMLKNIELKDEKLKAAKAALLDWDYLLEPGSITASIYVEWESAIRRSYVVAKVPPALLNFHGESLYYPQMKLAIDWVLYEADREEVLRKSLSTALETLEKRLGKDQSKWQYGQEKNKHVQIFHPLSAAVNDSLRSIFEAGPYPRGGYGLTVNNTSNGLNQRSGASFRFIVDTENWDNCLGMNSPGQSGDIRSPFYKNLFELWATNQFFPVHYSKEKVLQHSKEHRVLIPK
ncbi:MAG: penicillin acylase family protein [Bacteroidia bacterium]|nr:penicillin acylase family protein [Bacteroidia bacterium]